MSVFSYFQDDRLNHAVQKAALVVFDMNGLIVDDEEFQTQALTATLKRFNITLNEVDWNEKVFGRNSTEYLTVIMHDYNVPADSYRIDALVREKAERYREYVCSQLPHIVRKGVLEFFAYLLGCPSMRLALASSASSDEIDTVIGEAGLNIRRNFGIIVSGEEVTHSKPDPEIYRMVARLAGVAPSACVVFEDSSLGIDAAHGAGMHSVAVPNRFTRAQDFRKAHYVISDLTREAKVLGTQV